MAGGGASRERGVGLEYRILGPLEVVRDGQPLRLERPRERALLALLVLSANRVVSSDVLAEDLWGGAPPRSAASALRVHISRLRAAMDRDAEMLATEPPGYVLRVDEDAVDAVRFEALWARGRERAAVGDHAGAARVLREALGLWRGPALAEVADAPLARAEATRLDEARLAALEERIEADLTCGRHEEVISELEALSVAHPLRERIWGLRMLALYRAGRQAEALRTYQELRRRLAAELGIEPGAALSRLESAILRHDPGLDAPSESATPPSEPERKPATVLFAEVVGSLELALDPEEWGEVVERFLAILGGGASRFDGRLDRVTGETATLLFGAPIAYEDHARRACAAAVELRGELVSYGDELRRDRGVGFGVRMGLASGEVVVAPASGDAKHGYTAVGNPVSLAQRIGSRAEPGAVYLSAATAAAVAGYFDVRCLGPVSLEGTPATTEVFALLGSGALRTPLEVAAARGLSRFVGRNREMAVLDAALTQARQGNGQVVGLVAGPGLGKSRLAHEFVERCRAQGVDVFTAHGLAHARSVPFVPVLETVRAQFGIGEQDDSAAARTTVAAVVRDLDRSVEEALPLLYDFLGIADADQPAPPIDPEARQRRIFGALGRLRRARSNRGPVVLLFEDLHWLDPGSQEFLEHLIGGVPGTCCLVVTTFRPEYRAPWIHRSHYAQFPLDPLGDEASDELLRDLLGSHPSLDGLTARVRERTEGNPFFIEEVVQGFVEQGVLKGRRGAYELAEALGEVSIPASVRAVLAARIDRLSRRDKNVLQTAAVAGRQFSRRLLEAIAESATPNLEAALASLVETELIYEASSYPEEDYTFKHALVEEVAYGSLLAKRRARTHIAVARALAALDRDRLDERASLIAHHYEQGGEFLESVRWNVRAAGWAGLSNPAEAARHWRRVRRLTGQLDQTPETAEFGINARMNLLNCIWRLGAASEEGPVRSEDEAATMFAEAEALADSSGQPAVKVFALGLYGLVGHMGVAVKEGYELNVRGQRIADETGDPFLRTVIRMPLAWVLFVLGRIREAAERAEEIVAIIGEDRAFARGLMVTSPYAYCRMALALYRGYLDRLDDSLAATDVAIQIAGEEGDLESQAWAHRHWAMFADLAGADPDATAAHARAGLEWADRAGGAWSRNVLREGLATSHVQQGQWQEAIEVVDEALAIARDRRIGLAESPVLLAIRARAQIGQGDLPGARRSAEEAIAVAVSCGTRFYEAQARHQLARAILADPAPGEAKVAGSELDRALSIVEEIGTRVYAPHLHFDRARLARTIGDEAAYERQLLQAHRLFLEVGAQGWADEVAVLVQSD
jgi:DNA-binding SARP family transcriptional activator